MSDKLKSVSSKPYIKRGNLIFSNPMFAGQTAYRKIIAEVEDGYLTVGMYGESALGVEYFSKSEVSNE